MFESHEVVNRPLLERLLASKDYRARAYATRVVGRWHDRLKNPLALLRRSATDEHSRVRLEAIVAASDVREAESIAIARKPPMARRIALSPSPSKTPSTPSPANGSPRYWRANWILPNRRIC